MRRIVPMRVTHLLALIALMLVGLWGVTCDGRQKESPEEWDVRLDGIGSRCSGLLEMHHKDKWKRISGVHWSLQNAELACKQLHCGVPFGIVTPFSKEPEKQEICLRECQANATTFKDCTWQESNCSYHLGVVCQDPMQAPTVQPEPTTTLLMTSSKPIDTTVTMLEDGTALCSGTVELKFGGHWEMVCLGLQKWWKDLAPRVCEGADCEAAIELKGLGSKKPLPIPWEKVQCERKNLTLHCLNRTKPCLTLVKCSGQDFKPNPSRAETILRILLGLALTTFLLITCIPTIYKKIIKKYFKKRQHQWIGPNAVNQNVSFHRNSSASFHPHPQGQVVQEQDNRAFKKTSYLSPYAALEGATNRISNPLDNSSDSDYDLCSAQQL